MPSCIRVRAPSRSASAAIRRRTVRSPIPSWRAIASSLSPDASSISSRRCSSAGEISSGTGIARCQTLSNSAASASSSPEACTTSAASVSPCWSESGVKASRRSQITSFIGTSADTRASSPAAVSASIVRGCDGSVNDERS